MVSGSSFALDVSIGKSRIDRVKALLYQDELSLKSLESFLAGKDTSYLFITNPGNEAVVFSKEVLRIFFSDDVR